ncbi:MAG: hypoxanthine phosphoribosyltransferase [Synergistaceae bacterium]|nr:hypoxanthine phosphoribosyltransferase [Synergistaceae bacterium]
MDETGDYELDHIMLTRGAISERISELAASISGEYGGGELIFTGVLKGAVIFMSDLVRSLDRSVDARMDFIAVSSYGNASASSGAVKMIKDMDTCIEGKNVILVEDIMDTGLTLSYLKDTLTARGPETLRTCVLLEKPDRKKVDSILDYRGFTIPDEFVVGYGLDYAGKWRNLPDIWCVTKR